MKTENMLNKGFDCLAKRVIYSYKCKFPDFLPIDSDMATYDEQAQMNDFLRYVICCIYDNPDFISPYESDDCLENDVMNKTAPKLVAKMKAIEKKLVAFYELLFDIGKVSRIENGYFYVSKSDLKITGDKYKKLTKIGIDVHTENDLLIITNEKYPKCFKGWKLLAEICDFENQKDNKEMLWFRFMNGIFNVNAISEMTVYGGLLENAEFLDKLEKALLNLGYGYGYKDGRLRVIKEYPKKQQGYLAIEFAYRRKNQLSIEFHIPCFTKLLDSYEQMDDELRCFIYDRLKDCNSCTYCTQTDKSKTRKVLARLLEYGGIARMKCPLYPKFACNEPNSYITDNMIRLFTLADVNLVSKT